MDLFNFKISNEIRTHGDYKINCIIEFRSNNLQKLRKEIMEALELFLQQENRAMNSCRFLIKATRSKQTQEVFKEVNALNSLLNVIYNKSEIFFYNDRTVFSQNFESIFNYIEQGKSSLDLENLEAVFNDFSEWIKASLNKKIDMCEKLFDLEDRPLKSIISFNELGYETQFAKYHLNLEHFSDFMHQMLKKEFNKKYMDSYFLLEKNYFILINQLQDFDSIRLSDFFKITDKIFKIQKIFDEYPQPLIKAQVKYKEIQDKIQSVYNLMYDISNKFDLLYYEYKKYNQHPDLLDGYVAFLGFVYKMTLRDFLNKKEDYFEKYYQMIWQQKVKISQDENERILFINLEKIDPVAANQIKNKIINNFKLKNNCFVINQTEQFMISKNDKSIFEKNCYYTHSLFIYATAPKRADLIKNKYTIASGGDKILISKNILRFSGKIFVSKLNKEVNYDLFMEVFRYNINLSNFYGTKVV